MLNNQGKMTVLTPLSSLEQTRRWSPDPERRREAALLLHARARSAGDRSRQPSLLRGQGWGGHFLAPVVLKLDAADAQALGRSSVALSRWRDLWNRFPDAPASADALYVLGRKKPALRQELLRRFPSHPAALAAALEKESPASARLAGALHLARWGARWPGAHDRLRQVCAPQTTGLTNTERGQLADGLAQLRDGRSTLDCLTFPSADMGTDDLLEGEEGSEGVMANLALLSAPGRLNLAQTLLRQGSAERRLGEQLLLALAQEAPGVQVREMEPGDGARDTPTPEAEQAVRMLSEERSPQAKAALHQLPSWWQETSPVQARQVRDAVEAAGGVDPAALAAGMQVLRRWPQDHASWELQWDLARRQLLDGGWRGALAILEAIDPIVLPYPLATRVRFWTGYSQRQLGQHDAAHSTWRTLRLNHPGGYYGWRSAVHLGEGDLSLQPERRERPRVLFPLGSGDDDLDRLWRLDQRTEAWELWRTRRGGRPPWRYEDLLVEGRLRLGVGDDWTGLDRLERAALQLPSDRCDLLPLLEESLHPSRFPEAFQPAARSQHLPVDLLLAVAKQESRFTPAVRSVAGAVGLMQLMPATAAELADAPLSIADLTNPVRNVSLGARYLRILLLRWNNDPFLAVASYNAGPRTVQGWINPAVQQAPEMWVESIPYPETRMYVKKVLGNAWSYQQVLQPPC